MIILPKYRHQFLEAKRQVLAGQCSQNCNQLQALFPQKRTLTARLVRDVQQFEQEIQNIRDSSPDLSSAEINGIDGTVRQARRIPSGRADRLADLLDFVRNLIQGVVAYNRENAQLKSLNAALASVHSYAARERKRIETNISELKRQRSRMKVCSTCVDHGQ